MISLETASRIWNCYREIKVSKDLLKELEEHLKDPRWNPSPCKDSFGRDVGLSMGVPCGSDNSQRLYNVPLRLSLSIIRTHIAEQERQLVEANEQARIELDADKSLRISGCCKNGEHHLCGGGNPVKGWCECECHIPKDQPA